MNTQGQPITKTEGLKDETTPRLFKFFSFGGHYAHQMIKNLRLGRLYAPSLDKLNDPFEGMWEGCNILIDYPEKDDEFYRSLKRKGIISLCSSIEKDFPCTPESILMWAHYANSNKGFCVEFSDSIFKIESPQFGHQNIKYQHTLPYKESFFQDGELANKDKKRILFWKSDKWEYEHEVRICCNNVNEYVKLPSDCIKAIYCGSKISDMDFALLRTIANENNWNIFSLQPDNKTYVFLPTKVEE